MAERDDVMAVQRADAAGQAPGRSAEEIRRDIASKRESISETVDQLSNRFEQTFDWRTYISKHPLAALGVAAGVGFLAAGLFRHRRSPQNRLGNALADAAEDLTDRIRYQLDGLGLNRPGLMMMIKAAAAGAVARAAAGYFSNHVGPDDDTDTHDRQSSY